jgi:hypothetical protein
VSNIGLWFIRFRYRYLSDNILDWVKLMENIDDTGIEEILDPSALMICGRQE